MSSFALDTNTVIYFLKGEGQVAERWLRTNRAELFLPVVVVFELELGVLKSKSPQKRARQLSQLLSAVRVVSFDRAAAAHAADIRHALEGRGKPIGPLDVLIAGTARAHGATLVTRNTKEFSRVPGLKLENWYESPAPRFVP